MKIIHGRAPDAVSEQRTATFTGTVFADPVLAPEEGVTVNSVWFAPGARTHWHRHDRGQILIVTSGRGWVGDRQGERGGIRAGDVVWISPGEEHWHGADPGSYLVHTAISLGGHEWLEPVEEQDYVGQPAEARR